MRTSLKLVLSRGSTNSEFLPSTSHARRKLIARCSVWVSSAAQGQTPIIAGGGRGWVGLGWDGLGPLSLPAGGGVGLGWDPSHCRRCWRFCSA
jgi:hypothetical protein